MFYDDACPKKLTFFKITIGRCKFILAGVTMTLFCTHGRVSGPSSLLDLEVMAPRGYSVPCQF